MKRLYDQYAADVVSGKRIAGAYTIAAAKRHLDDLEHGHERGITFDHYAAEIVIRFFENVLKHSKGKWAGDPIQLEAWEQFIIASIFGWVKDDGTRRFRSAYIEVARKNGKTLLASGIGLFMTLLDNEGGAEVYSAATTRDQARLSHGEAVRMVKQSPILKRELRLFKDNINHEGTFSKFEPLSSDYNSLDGLNIHLAICDEVHAWKSRDLYDILRTAMGSRRQPLILTITTAGYDRQSLCYQLHEYSKKILDGVLLDDSHFGIIYAMDEGDQWEDEQVWYKANPNLGVSKSINDLRLQATQAAAMPAALNSFLRLHLDVWTQAEDRWILPDVWRASGSAIDLDKLAGRKCYAGLDLSTTTDISAFVLAFPPLDRVNGRYDILAHFFIPEDNIEKRVRIDRVPYDVWIRHGYIKATPGNVIDYAFIMAEMEAAADIYDLQEIAFDRWGATAISTEAMERGLNMVQFGQGYASMSGPMKEVEKLILSQKLNHGNNPVLTWMADNTAVAMDPAGNVKPDKGKSRERIDGIVAMIMAMARAIINEKSGSVYDTRGIRTL